MSQTTGELHWNGVGAAGNTADFTGEFGPPAMVLHRDCAFQSIVITDSSRSGWRISREVVAGRVTRTFWRQIAEMGTGWRTVRRSSRNCLRSIATSAATDLSAWCQGGRPSRASPRLMRLLATRRYPERRADRRGRPRPDGRSDGSERVLTTFVGSPRSRLSLLGETMIRHTAEPSGTVAEISSGM
jgi:hypothetical protein